MDPKIGVQIDNFLNKLRDYASGKVFPFTFIIDDPSGNSHIKNPYAPQADSMIKIQTYERTNEQLNQMGFEIENSIINQPSTTNVNANEVSNKNENKSPQKPEEEVKAEINSKYDGGPDHLVQVGAHRLDLTKPLVEDLKTESFGFTTDCHVCAGKCETKMCVIEIPYFKELIIMSTNCQNCGAHTTETKTGGYRIFNVSHLVFKLIE